MNYLLDLIKRDALDIVDEVGKTDPSLILILEKAEQIQINVKRLMGIEV